MNSQKSKKKRSPESAEILVLRLYITGDAPHSHRAKTNLDKLVAENLPRDCVIEVVDISKTPGRALDDSILVTPTLYKASPAPVCRIIGDLSDHDKVLSTLGI